MSSPSTLGANIRLARRESGMSGAFVADKLHISAAAYRRYERDETTPPSTIILKLSNLWGVTTDAVMRGGGEDSPPLPTPLPTPPPQPPTQPLIVDLAPGQVLRIEINASVQPGSSGGKRGN